MEQQKGPRDPTALDWRGSARQEAAFKSPANANQPISARPRKDGIFLPI